MASILFVCTGNICRSPTAEGMLRQQLRDQGLQDQIRVDSAATHAYHIGDPPSQPAQDCAVARGYDLSALRARKVQPGDFNDFDLIVAMDGGHMEILADLRPSDSRAERRLFMEFAPGPGSDVPDPYYGGRADYEATFDLIASGMPGLIEALRRQLP